MAVVGGFAWTEASSVSDVERFDMGTGVLNSCPERKCCSNGRDLHKRMLYERIRNL